MSKNEAAREDLLAVAQQVVTKCRALGAHEVTAGISTGSHVSITRRDRKVEEASEATTRRLSVSLLVDNRYSSHSTSDLRPAAVDAFLRAAVDSTRFVEEDPDRALPPAELCGRGVTEDQLDQLDPAWQRRTAHERASEAEALEDAILALRDSAFVSATVSASDGHSRGAVAATNGFADETEGAWFSAMTTLTLSDEEGRRPEGFSYYGVRHLADMPSPEQLAAEANQRAREMIGSGPIDSGRYTLILPGRSAARILGVLGGPLNGSSLHYGRSCLAGKLGENIGSSALTLIDDPTIPRGLGSAPWDGDSLRAQRRTIIEQGELRSYYIDMYYSRKLGMAPTTGGPSNWVVPPGARSWKEIAREHERAILVTGFLGGNSNGLTGDFSYGIRGQFLERGEPVKSLSEMNVTGNVLQIFHHLREVANDPWVYSSVRSPSLVFTDIQFSGT